MEKRFSELPHVQPVITQMLKIDNVYIIKNIQKDQSYPERVQVVSIVANIYLMEMVDENNTSTGNWIKMSHEHFDMNYEVLKAVSSRESLVELSETFKPNNTNF